MTGYADAPAGVKLMEGQHFNPYFPGGAIGMAQALYNEIIEYSDGKFFLHVFIFLGLSKRSPP